MLMRNGISLLLWGLSKFHQLRTLGFSLGIRVDMVRMIHDNLLTQWRHIPKGQFCANIFLIRTTKNINPLVYDVMVLEDSRESSQPWPHYCAYLAVGIICLPPRWIGSFATMASRILNLQFRMGSSQRGPSLTPHWNPWTMESLTEPSRPLSTSDGSVSSTNMLGPGKKINRDGLLPVFKQILYFVNMNDVFCSL